MKKNALSLKYEAGRVNQAKVGIVTYLVFDTGGEFFVTEENEQILTLTFHGQSCILL